MFTVNRNPSKKDLRWFAAAMLVGFPLLGILFLWMAGRGDGSASSRFFWIGGVFLVLLGLAGGATSLASPALGRKLYIAWMTLTLPVGIAVSTVLLTLLYFVLLPIFSLIVRRNDPLRKKLGGTTYWEDYKPHENTLERMRRPF